ncbi:protocatechuate 3,4-dioxygenase subunit alpha [Azospirillum picis]|uniref:Protocatechuate 3,4-dioxygenase alpha subunit n=1 Tax=Azospirillum picis TaxID=488438 RepID=A0ABU0MCW8_9PROT|nr:protocatechuate 3,4-dioxygenase subunit alpha [Azospirillum picis]MBP2297701.1 protocatechuate 3,4-dioxygenase alpha subunit [Azospirillum picis]MDQ0531276.1 protocatechuate 3,4-dioxygenase alpha subunit [Azospirillum picis]
MSQTLKQTPSQTVGPYFAYAWTPERYGRRPLATNRLAADLLSAGGPPGEPIRIEGIVRDGEGAPIRDCVVEIWQARTDGTHAPGAAGFGRCGTDDQGRYAFDTVKPGTCGDDHAPHIAVTVFARGMLSHVFTRLHFSDEAAANAEDPVLATVPADRRDTLIARRGETPGSVVYRFDIRLQGEGETVFFDC